MRQILKDNTEDLGDIRVINLIYLSFISHEKTRGSCQQCGHKLCQMLGIF